MVYRLHNTIIRTNIVPLAVSNTGCLSVCLFSFRSLFHWIHWICVLCHHENKIAVAMANFEIGKVAKSKRQTGPQRKKVKVDDNEHYILLILLNDSALNRNAFCMRYQPIGFGNYECPISSQPIRIACEAKVKINAHTHPECCVWHLKSAKLFQFFQLVFIGSRVRLSQKMNAICFFVIFLFFFIFSIFVIANWSPKQGTAWRVSYVRDH